MKERNKNKSRNNQSRANCEQFFDSSTCFDMQKSGRRRALFKLTVDLVMLCGRQNIALRGRRDDSKHLEDEHNNPGNFQELYDFGARCANKAAEKYPKNATYR